MAIWKGFKPRTSFYLLTLLLGISQSVFAVNIEVNGTSSDYNILTFDTENNVQDLSGGADDTYDNGDTLRLSGNTWKKVLINYTITENTILQFDFMSTVEGEIHGIGFCVNHRHCHQGQGFRLYGKQDWFNETYNTYSSEIAPNWRTYSIPVGEFFTGRFSHLFFVADKDEGDPNAESIFHNIRIFEADNNPDNLPYATLDYAEPSQFKQPSDIDNIAQEDNIMSYEFLANGGLHGDGAFKATPVPEGYEDSTGWTIPNFLLANHSREPLFISGVYYFSEEWVNTINNGTGGKFIDFSLHSDDNPDDRDYVRISSVLSRRGDAPRFDKRSGACFKLNRGGAGWAFSGRSFAPDNGLFLEDVAGMWFWLGYYIDFENNRVSAYVKTGPRGPYPTVTRVLHRTNNNVLTIIEGVGHGSLNRHPWVRGEIITGQTSGATAILNDYSYKGITVTPLSGNFVDIYDVKHNGIEGELIIGSQSGALSRPLAAENWNWNRTTEGLDSSFSGIINGYWGVKESVPITPDMCHITDEVAVGNGWIDPPTFPASETDEENRCTDRNN
jgi:hypothetical protein